MRYVRSIFLSICAVPLVLAACAAMAQAKTMRANERQAYATALERVRAIIKTERELARDGFAFSADIPASCRAALATFDRHNTAQALLLLLVKNKDLSRSAKKGFQRELDKSYPAMRRIQKHLDEANCRVAS